MDKTHFDSNKNARLYELVRLASAAMKSYEEQIAQYHDFGRSARNATAANYADFIHRVHGGTDALAGRLLSVISDIGDFIAKPEIVVTLSESEGPVDKAIWFQHAISVLREQIAGLRHASDLLASAHMQFGNQRKFLVSLEDASEKHRQLLDDAKSSHKTSMTVAYTALAISVIINLATYFFPKTNHSSLTRKYVQVGCHTHLIHHLGATTCRIQPFDCAGPKL